MKPMMTKKEIRFIKKTLLKLSVGNSVIRILEWGSGGSTVYFTDFLKKNSIEYFWQSVEYNKNWYEKINEIVSTNNNINIKFFNVGSNSLKQINTNMDEYVSFPSNNGKKYDLIIVDGRKRRRCLLEAKKVLKEGGVVFLHDAQREYYRCAFSSYPFGRFVSFNMWEGSNERPNKYIRSINKLKDLYSIFSFRYIIVPIREFKHFLGRIIKKKNQDEEKIVVYTAIFGEKDKLKDPKYLPPNTDFICFTDDKNLKSNIWKVIYVNPPFSDPVRCARYIKIMPHLFLSDYKQSIWIDGNMIVKGNIRKALRKYLKNGFTLATYDHKFLKKRILKIFWKVNKSFARNCVYKEADDLLRRMENGFYLDDPNLIKNQVKKYKELGYPENNGLAATMIVYRRHNNKELIKVMEDWWDELKNGSRRDQLSFNFVLWKNSFLANLIEGDPRYNPYFSKIVHAKKINPIAQV